MTAKYRLKPVVFDAVQYTGQRVEDLPAWAKDYVAHTDMGEQVIGKSAVGELLVPRAGSPATCRHGDWLILNPDTNVIQAVTGRDFAENYEAVDGADD